MGDAEERLVWGTNGGDGRQTPPGQLGVSPKGDEEEVGAAVSGGPRESEEPGTPPKVVEEEEEEEELDPRIQVRCGKGLFFPVTPHFGVWEGSFFPSIPIGGGGGHSRFGGFSSFTPYLASPPTPQEELEHLNQANEEINRVELQLDVSLSPVPYWSPSPRSLVLNWFPSPFSSLPNWFPTCPPQSLTGPPQSLSPGS